MEAERDIRDDGDNDDDDDDDERKKICRMESARMRKSKRADEIRFVLESSPERLRKTT